MALYPHMPQEEPFPAHGGQGEEKPGGRGPLRNLYPGGGGPQQQKQGGHKEAVAGVAEHQEYCLICGL